MPVERLVFAADGFGAYHDLYGVGTDVSRTGAPFSARVEIVRLPRMMMFVREISGVAHGRGPARVRRDGFDHLTLHLLLAGRHIGGAIGQTALLEPGEVQIFDTRHPHWNRVNRASLLSLAVAREQLPPGLADKPLHGRIVPAGQAASLAGLMQALAHGGAAIGTAQIGQALGEALALALGHESGGLTLGRGLARRERAERYIDEHLADPRLDAAAIAAGIGISRATLYRDFAEEGIERVLIERRLARFRRVLLAPLETREVGEIARSLGFSSPSFATRAFRSAFGRPPGGFRATLATDRRSPTGIDLGIRSRLERWNAELY